jgi:hypothetical protein
LDRKDEKGMEKAFLQARTIDFAKFGRLYLNKGNWEEIRLFQEHG